MKKKTFSSLVILIILLYGIFKDPIREFYANLINAVLSLVSINSEFLTAYFENLEKSKFPIDGIIGWLIYYPSYFLLHIILIQILFREFQKLKFWFTAGFVLFILFLFSTIIIGKTFEFQLLYSISYKIFQQLFGLPFFLLLIEGGFVLFSDIILRENNNYSNDKT